MQQAVAVVGPVTGAVDTGHAMTGADDISRVDDRLTEIVSSGRSKTPLESQPSARRNENTDSNADRNEDRQN